MASAEKSKTMAGVFAVASNDFMTECHDLEASVSGLSTGRTVSWRQLGKRLVALNLAVTCQNGITKALLSKASNLKKEREGKGQQNDNCLCR
jgi:hypothetical protein